MNRQYDMDVRQISLLLQIEGSNTTGVRFSQELESYSDTMQIFCIFIHCDFLNRQIQEESAATALWIFNIKEYSRPNKISGEIELSESIQGVYF